MILNQLKKQLTEARKITEEKKDANKGDQYASGFTAPSRTVSYEISTIKQTNFKLNLLLGRIAAEPREERT